MILPKNATVVLAALSLCVLVAFFGVMTRFGGFGRVVDAESLIDSRDRGLMDRSEASDAVELPPESDGTTPTRQTVAEVASTSITLLGQSKAIPSLTAREGASSIEEESHQALTGKKKSLRWHLLQEAGRLARQSETPWLDLAEVARGFHKIGDAERADAWFQHATKRAHDPDDSHNTNRRLREVVKSMIQADFFELARQTIPLLTNTKLRSQVQSDLASAYARRGDFADAHQLAEQITLPDVRAHALRLIAEKEVVREGIDVALQTIDAAPAGDGRDAAFRDLAPALVRAGELDAAVSLANRIADERLRDQAFARISRASATPSTTLLPLIVDPFFRDETLIELIHTQIDGSRVEQMNRQAGRIHSSQDQARAQEALVKLQVRHGDLNDARARAQSITQEDSRIRAIQTVAEAEVRAYGLDDARATAQLIPPGPGRDVALRKIAERAAVFDDPQAASETILEVRDPDQRALALANVALVRARVGDDYSARLFSSDADRVLPATRPAGEARVLEVLAEVHAETGESRVAFDTAQAIENASRRDQAYQRLALHFAREPDPQLATQSVERIGRETTKDRAMASVARTLASRVPASSGLSLARTFSSRRQQVRFLVELASRS